MFDAAPPESSAESRNASSVDDPAMRIVIDVPPKDVPLSGGCEVPVTCSGHLWSEGCLGKYANERGVYVHHHAGSIKYVGKTETQDMCFGKRLRREFTEGGSGGRHIYPKLTALLTPPAIRTYFFTTEAIRGLVATRDLVLSDAQRIAIFETVLIQVYQPEFQCTPRPSLSG